MTEDSNERRPGEPDVESALGEYAASFSLDNVPPRVRDRARLVLLDTLGVSIRGSEANYVRRTLERGAAVGIWGASGGSTAFATRDERSPAAAAFANASGATTLELDEGNQRSGHMGVHVVPPAVAVAEAAGASGADLLEAVVLAYEVSARVGDANRPLRGELHPHGEWAAVGAAVAAGSLYGFDADEYARAIRIATNPFLGVHWGAALEGATVRNFYSGVSCRHGLTAALLASSGVSGMEGSIARALLAHTAADEEAPERLGDRVGTLRDEYYLESSYVKIHAACRYAHPPLDALERVEGIESIDPGSIDGIRVRSFEAAIALDDDRPDTVLAAKFSIPYAIAARLVLGTSGVDAFDESHLADDRIRRLASRVEVAWDDRFERARRERDDWGAEVEVVLEDGDARSAAVTNARGGGEKPFTGEEVVAKFDRLVGALEPPATVASIRRRVLDVEAIDDVGSLFDELR